MNLIWLDNPLTHDILAGWTMTLSNFFLPSCISSATHSLITQGDRREDDGSGILRSNSVAVVVISTGRRPQLIWNLRATVHRMLVAFSFLAACLANLFQCQLAVRRLCTVMHVQSRLYTQYCPVLGAWMGKLCVTRLTFCARLQTRSSAISSGFDT